MPETDGLTSNKRRLEFATTFATAQRARSARQIYDSALACTDEMELLMLHVDAFEEMMLATEDTLGWLHALREWRFSGVPLIETLRKFDLNPTIEQKIEAYLEEITLDELRSILGATVEDLAKLPDDVAAQVDPKVAIPAQLEGLKRVVAIRRENERQMPRAYNKSKHMLLADIVVHEDQPRLAYLTSTTGHLYSLGATSESVRRKAGTTVVAQSVLHSILALVLMTQFNVPYTSPQWVEEATQLDSGWLH